MCGIVGVVAREGAAPAAADILIDGLRRLEYRGYDSAGIATLAAGAIASRRAAGKLARLEKKLAAAPLAGQAGIGHTRWATHGAPSEANAHPHIAGRVAVVHNGIVENFHPLRRELETGGARFASETDTEVAAHLLDRLLADGLTLEQAMAEAMKRLQGMFALAFLIGGTAQTIVAARRGAPLALGWGEGAMFLASDALALAPWTTRVSYLLEDDVAFLDPEGARIVAADGRQVERPQVDSQLSGALVGKGGHRHFMAKEIHEQPTAVGETLARYLDPVQGDLRLPPELEARLAASQRVALVACGTAFYAARIGAWWLERLARLPAWADIASEFRYRDAPLPEDGAAFFVSQSGETADTLSALRHAQSQGQTAIAITNTATSTMAREADIVLPTHAGPEICVAGTKTFTCQLAVLAAVAIAAARARGRLQGEAFATLAAALAQLPSTLARALQVEEQVRAVAHELADARDVLYLGRGPAHVIALEGALKLKEISYIHAEGHAAGEMKHGPIALIDDQVPVVVVAPDDDLFEKTVTNAREAAARGGRIVLIADRQGAERAGNLAWRSVTMPQITPLLAPIVYALPMQMLAYHAALRKGTDVDQPRNLAKSVTVE